MPRTYKPPRQRRRRNPKVKGHTSGNTSNLSLDESFTAIINAVFGGRHGAPVVIQAAIPEDMRTQ